MRRRRTRIYKVARQESSPAYLSRPLEVLIKLKTSLSSWIWLFFTNQANGSQQQRLRILQQFSFSPGIMPRIESSLSEVNINCHCFGNMLLRLEQKARRGRLNDLNLASFKHSYTFFRFMGLFVQSFAQLILLFDSSFPTSGFFP